jgi:hypothetical protein
MPDWAVAQERLHFLREPVFFEVQDSLEYLKSGHLL